jgi:hypothetical protein
MEVENYSSIFPGLSTASMSYWELYSSENGVARLTEPPGLWLKLITTNICVVLDI